MSGIQSSRYGVVALVLGLLLASGVAVAEEPGSTLPPPRLVPLTPGERPPTAPPPPATATARTSPNAHVRARFAAQLTPDQLAELAYVEHLGWRFLPSQGVKEITIHGGHPARHDSVRQAQMAGDLRVLIPPTATDAELKTFAERLPAIADSAPSMGAWNHRLAIAQKRACLKLKAATDADRYVFPYLLVIQSPWWQLGLPEPEWEEVDRIWRARESSARAIEAIYTKDGKCECYVGQMIALLCGQYELMGPRWFDDAYHPHELIVGRPQHVEDTPFGWNSMREGYHRRRALYITPEKNHTKDPGVLLAEFGHMAFPGRCGIIQNPDDGFFCNENFTIVSMTREASEALRLNGGFPYVRKLMMEALDTHKSSENLLAPRHEVFAKQRRVEELLSNPALTGMEVYIHPFGVITLREIVEEKMRLKTAAIEIKLYCSGRDLAFYERYHTTWLKRWKMVNLPATVTVPCSPGS